MSAFWRRGYWLLAVLLTACGSQPPRPVETPSPAPKAAQPPAPPVVGGGYYENDGPGAHPPKNLAAIPNAQPKIEPLDQQANQPYSVFGHEYVPMTHLEPYQARGMASWYGRKFNGHRTATGEIYNMYGMTAAHPTLPLPSYARVTNPANGRSVVVRVNDRGPFLDHRLIDLSYTAAAKLGIVASGSAMVRVQSIIPGKKHPVEDADPIGKIAMAQTPDPPAAQPTPTLPELRGARGVYLQLGAFGDPANADNFKSHLASALADLADKLTIRSRGNLYRVDLGPWPDHAEARRVAVRLRKMFDLKPLVVRR